MNIVFLFLTRDDLNAIPRIPEWLNSQGKIESMMAVVNPHMAIDPSSDQVGLENQIALSIGSTLIPADARMALEMSLQQRWMQIPREVMMSQLDTLFSPIRLSQNSGLVVLSESFQVDRVPELLTKLRPAWPAQIPLGKFVLVFPNQIPEKEAKVTGRPKGKVTDPVKLEKMRANLAAARAKRKQNREAVSA